MVIKFDHRHRKLDGDILLTMACPNECDFCIYSCTASKEPVKWMPEETIRRVAEEYSKNDIGVRISGGEPFYDLEKLRKCIDILLEFYKPTEVLIITSGFFAVNKEMTKEHLNVIKEKSFDTLVVSVDRFHQKKIPLSNIVNILEIAKELDIDIVLRASFDLFSFPLIDSLAETIVKYRTPVEIHNWSVIGRGERLDKSPLVDFDKAREYLFSKIKEFSEKYNAPPDPRYYLMDHSPKRSQRSFCRIFFPTTFPNGNVYGCSMTTKLGYMGNINKEDLLDMVLKWRKTLPGFFVISDSGCGILKNFLPEKSNHYCEFCKDQPLKDKNLPKEALGREFVKIDTKIDLDKLVEKLSKEDKEYLLSFRLTENDLNIQTGIKIKKFLNELKYNKIRFVLSRPLPRCLGIITDNNQPKNCWECRELFTVEDGFIEYCDALGSRQGLGLRYVPNREQLYEHFEIEHKKLEFFKRCKSCLFRIRNQCNGMCFKKEKISHSEEDTSWEKILNEEILFKSHGKILSRKIELEKIIDYFKRNQTAIGYFKSISPMIYNTYFLVGILNLINEKISENTINYIRSLQVGGTGFSETTGEVPWSDKTQLALEMFRWCGIEPKNKLEMVKFFQSFQNEDGGFGTIATEHSCIEGMIENINILSLLDSLPNEVQSAILWIKQNFPLQTHHHIFNYIDILIRLGYKFEYSEKEQMKSKLYQFSDSFLNRHEIPFSEWYFCLQSLKLLNADIGKYSHIKNVIMNCMRDNPFFIPENPREAFFMIRTSKLLGGIFNFRDNILRQCKNLELKEGGFYIPDEISTIKNDFAYQTLLLIDGLTKIDSKNFINWVLSTSNSDGWGSSPYSNFLACNEYTATSLLALRLSGFKSHEIKNREGIMEMTFSELNKTLSYPKKANYIILRTIKNILEIWMLLNLTPRDVVQLAETILEYRNKDGGFGGKYSYMYATFWAIRSLYLISKYDEKINDKISLVEISSFARDWIYSCQNEDGGFGPMKGQPSTIQSTFLALYSLWMIKEEIKSIDLTINYLLKHQNNDGGLSGAPSMTSDLLHSLYVIGSLVICMK